MAKNVHPPQEWDEFDELAAPVTPRALPAIPCGLYHVDEPGGSTIPIKVRRRSDRSRCAAGKWVMEWLIGHDERTWEEFAFVGQSLDIYKKFRDTDYDRVGTMLFKHFSDGECFDGWEFRLTEPRCARCGRKLNKHDQESGIGKACAKEWGL